MVAFKMNPPPETAGIDRLAFNLCASIEHVFDTYDRCLAIMLSETDPGSESRIELLRRLKTHRTKMIEAVRHSFRLLGAAAVMEANQTRPDIIAISNLIERSAMNADLGTSIDQHSLRSFITRTSGGG